MNPATQWGWTETFLNKVIYLLEVLAWQNATPTRKGEKAKHLAQKPQLYRPGWLPKLEESDLKKDTIATDVETMKEILARPRN